MPVYVSLGYEQETDDTEVPSFISCIFILQSVVGLMHPSDNQYLKIYVSWSFPRPSLKLHEDPSPDLPLGTFYDTPQITVKHSEAPGMPLSIPAGAGCALAPGSAGWGPRLSLQPSWEGWL